MFNKPYYGIKVPDNEDFDYMNNEKLRVIKKQTVQLFKDGFQRIEHKNIQTAEQTTNESNKVRENYPSCTASGYLKKKHGRG